MEVKAGSTVNYKDFKADQSIDCTSHSASKMQISSCEELTHILAPITHRGLSWSAGVGKKKRMKMKEKLCITNYPFTVSEYGVKSQSGALKCQMNAEKQSWTGALQTLRRMQSFFQKARDIYNSIQRSPSWLCNMKRLRTPKWHKPWESLIKQCKR